MADPTDVDRISQKAHEIWEGEGRPHGRDQAHWDQAKEIVALQDSMGETLLPPGDGSEPEEPAVAVINQGEMPGLTDQGPDDLTSTDREPMATHPTRAKGEVRGEGGTVVSAQEMTPQAESGAAGTGPDPDAAAKTAPKGVPPEMHKPEVVTPSSAAPEGRGKEAKAPDPTVKDPVGHGAATSGTAATPKAGKGKNKGSGKKGGKR